MIYGVPDCVIAKFFADNLWSYQERQLVFRKLKPAFLPLHQAWAAGFPSAIVEGDNLTFGDQAETPDLQHAAGAQILEVNLYDK